MSIYKEPPPGMFVVPDPHDMTKIHALITGPFDTPYEGGFFLFLFRCPPDYPIHPPRVKLMTTGNNTVRFNPNFYRNGKVCLSILGTWTGPAWSPAQSISSVLISIQSLMTENPYHNEPGFEQVRTLILNCMADGTFSNSVIEKIGITCRFKVQSMDSTFFFHFLYNSSILGYMTKEEDGKGFRMEES
ncbi:PREDICTED: ubiquitin-conjugating enzyme E2 Z-like [Thamnophis sirtalis]|uniref:Ubiquitin-conjugating enzyme E2 Z n=1 Tax=Thamnophis sirtalis TaxID=35019 RepID=A0A6I9XMX9_9SAUR|nr:PREDICTED: ubiquitin-conjugating enzyme E2 Z-like [Thamnophis sirtalis]